jgi:predicted secreted protein
MADLDDSGLSRRTMLKGAAGVGAAGLAASALASVALPAAAATKAQVRATRGQSSDAAGDEAIVVHVRDAASGEIDVFRGTTQTRLHDRDLAARLVRASR